MTKIDEMAKLLSSILESQLETGQYGVVDQERLRQALTTGSGFSEKEQALLLLSPLARNDFRRIHRKLQNELKIHLKVQGVELELLPMAAAASGDKMVMQGNGFTVTLYRQDELGIPWIILVQLGKAYRQAVNPFTVLRLVDSGGLEWLRGKPDANGEITATWNDPETDIIARSRRFSLTLEPV